MNYAVGIGTLLSAGLVTRNYLKKKHDRKRQQQGFPLVGVESEVLASDPKYVTRPNLKDTFTLIDGVVKPWKRETIPVFSPLSVNGEKVCIGRQAVMHTEDALLALDAAVRAWDHGQGVWPTMKLEDRVKVVSTFTAFLKQKREAIANILQWEICKTTKDSYSEFDRTIEYIEQTLKAITQINNESSVVEEKSGLAVVRKRAGLGVVMVMGPSNYPFNETYAMFIPALLMGNTVVMKLPNIGSLAHVETMELFATHFPPGVVNFVTGRGRNIIPPLMQTGKVDSLAFIGGSHGADSLIRAHPKPHRLTSVLGLEAKNPAIIFPGADLDKAAKECLLGALSYNGQRCTALKLLLVHTSIANQFLSKFVTLVEALKCGLPWKEGVTITHLAEPAKPTYILNLVMDAINKGATVLNPSGCQRSHGLMFPTVLFPVSSDMRVFHEEQFGPVVPIASFSTNDELRSLISVSQYGQQASLFLSTSTTTTTNTNNTDSLGSLIDFLSNNFARININGQCKRSPDHLPFTGRKSSALGTLSVTDALKAFSLEIICAASIADKPLIFDPINNKQESSFLSYHN